MGHAAADGKELIGAREGNSDVDEVVDGLLSASRVLVALAARSINHLDAEVTLAQYRAMVVLASRGPQRTVDLATELEVQPSTITRLCDRLVRKGLVERRQRADDRRATWLALTPTGRDLVGEAMRHRRDDIAELVAATDLSEPRRLAATLRSFSIAAGEVPDPEWWQRWERSADDQPGTWTSLNG